MAGSKTAGIEPVDLTQSAACAVAADGVSELCRDGEADAVDIGPVLSAVDHKTGRDEGLPFGVDAPEVAVFFHGKSCVQSNALKYSKNDLRADRSALKMS